MKPGEIIASFAIIAIIIVIVAVIGPHFYSSDGCGCGYYNIGVTTNRAGNDSITITYNGGPDAGELRTNDSFVIHVNDKNATNMDAIKQSGLDATLDPATGLENKVGSMVTIRGSEITNKTHVVVSTFFRDGTTQVVLDSYVR